MYVHEALEMDKWFKLYKLPGCDIKHTQRGVLDNTEFANYSALGPQVQMYCDDIFCHYKWFIPKNLFFIDDFTLMSYMMCPVCGSLTVTATWVYYCSVPMDEWDVKRYFMYEVVNEVRHMLGPNTIIHAGDPMFGIILHFLQQYPIRTIRHF